MDFRSLLAALLGVFGMFSLAQSLPLAERNMLVLRLGPETYGQVPLDQIQVGRLEKRAVKRERILDSLGGDYLIRKRTVF
ncbi:unnamed protein product [Bursaphelenchus xylophilus]|uniref:(pine wood nematode) hypothetical protein n=1 Tax=Bursaphelenchus xylophilus TaxID=6326 RepID=A0A1I7SRN6_BURXY|nr:unnamed protein product [Bursaphelenchus xylophilus]CAG9102071.1 unnamed protein product [Bursaphelenchus xylophilus]